MSKLLGRKISNRTVEGLFVEGKDVVFWDPELLGFGVRVYPSGARVYVVQTRVGGTSRRVTVGRHGVLTASQARRRAALVIARIKAGEELPEPARTAWRGETGALVTDLAERFMREHVAVRSPSGSCPRSAGWRSGRSSTSTSRLLVTAYMEPFGVRLNGATPCSG